jgi:hypothetical protein
MLNHFQMAVPIGVCGLFLLGYDRRAFAVYLTAVVAAAGLFLAVDPYALQSLAFNAQVNVFEPVTVRSTANRFLRAAIGLLHFLAMEPKWTRVITLSIPLVLLAALLRPRRARWWHWPRRLGMLGRLTLLLLAVDTLMYVTWLLPYHAYGAYYFPGLIVLTPLWLAVALRRVIRTATVRWALVGVLLLSSAGSMRRQFDLYAQAAVATNALATADIIGTDAVRIHGVPRIVGPASPDAWVIATTRDRLAEAVGPAIRAGRRVVLAVDNRRDPAAPPDALDALLADALASGRLRPQGGLIPFSPEFQLYRTD